MPPSDAEALAFATSFETTLVSGNTAAINAAIDFDALTRRAMLGAGVPEGLRLNLVRNAKLAWSGPNGIASQFAKWIAAGGRYRLLHVHRQGDEQLRGLSHDAADSGIDFVDFILLRDADGNVRIGDFYDYGLGELESDERRRQIVGNLARTSQEFLRDARPHGSGFRYARERGFAMRDFVAANAFSKPWTSIKECPSL